MPDRFKRGTPFQFQINAGPGNKLITLLLLGLGMFFLLVFGVWLLMILATLAVVLLPWFWWKRRQLLKKMAEHANHAAAEQPHSGVVIEGELIHKEQQDDKNN